MVGFGVHGHRYSYIMALEPVWVLEAVWSHMILCSDWLTWIRTAWGSTTKYSCACEDLGPSLHASLHVTHAHFKKRPTQHIHGHLVVERDTASPTHLSTRHTIAYWLPFTQAHPSNIPGQFTINLRLHSVEFYTFCQLFVMEQWLLHSQPQTASHNGTTYTCRHTCTCIW